MILKITCLHCGNEVLRNPRLKNQKYCCEKECQKARMRTWKTDNTGIAVNIIIRPWSARRYGEANTLLTNTKEIIARLIRNM